MELTILLECDKFFRGNLLCRLNILISNKHLLDSTNEESIWDDMMIKIT